MSKFLTGTIATVAVLSIAANVLLYERYSTARPLVRVGNDVITRKEYQDAVDYQTQGQVLKKMVYAKLVTQAATKAGLMPKDKDVEDRIAAIRRQGQGPMMQALAAADHDPARMADLKQSLATDIALENLAIQGFTASDSEVAAYYASHKATFAVPRQVEMTLVVTGGQQGQLDNATALALLRQGMQPDVIARQRGMHVVGVNGFNVNMQALAPADRQRLNAAVFRMKPGPAGVQGMTVKTLQGETLYLAIRANKSLGAGVPPLAQVRDQVARQVREEKAARALVDRGLPRGTDPNQYELATLYQQMKPEFVTGKYATYFADIENAATAWHDAKKTASAR